MFVYTMNEHKNENAAPSKQTQLTDDATQLFPQTLSRSDTKHRQTSNNMENTLETH